MDKHKLLSGKTAQGNFSCRYLQRIRDLKRNIIVQQNITVFESQWTVGYDFNICTPADRNTINLRQKPMDSSEFDWRRDEANRDLHKS